MRLSFTISTASHVFRRTRNYADLAAVVDADGLDIDATSWVGRRTGLRSGLNSELAVPISSIWITPADLTSLPMIKVPTPFPTPSQRAVQIVVLLPESSGIDHDQTVIKSTSKALGACVWAAGSVIAVPAQATDGGRAHLTRLRGLRRLAEEWEMQIALDLSTKTDARWEAEAAIQIVGPRLSILRLRAPIRDGVGRHSDVLVRAIRASADLGFSGVISIAPSTPYWLAWHSESLRNDLAANRDAVIRIFRQQPSSIERPNSASLR
jgi:hypothetical protein